MKGSQPLSTTATAPLSCSLPAQQTKHTKYIHSGAVKGPIENYTASFSTDSFARQEMNTAWSSLPLKGRHCSKSVSANDAGARMLWINGSQSEVRKLVQTFKDSTY